MDLVGFFNRGSAYPNWLLPIGRDEQSFYAFYPSGDVVLLKGAASQAEIERRATFVPKPEGADAVPRLAFAFAANDIISGDIPSVTAAVGLRVGQFGQGSEIKAAAQEALQSLTNTSSLPKEYRNILGYR